MLPAYDLANSVDNDGENRGVGLKSKDRQRPAKTAKTAKTKNKDGKDQFNLAKIGKDSKDQVKNQLI